MDKNLLDKIDDLFKNPQSLSMQQLEEFVHEVLKFFDALRTKMTTGTEEEKNEALKEAQEMQQKLQQYAQKAYEKLGMSESDIQKYLAQGKFLPEDMKHFHNAEKEINEFKKTLNPAKLTSRNKKSEWGNKI